MTETKVVVITGGGKGLGKVTALKFAKDGYHVAILGRNQQDLEATAQELQATGAKVFWKVCNVGDWQSVENAFAAVEAECGGVDVLVNNAGGWSGDNLSIATPETIQTLVDSIILGTTFCTKAALPFMKEKGAGFIVNVGSTSGLLNSSDVAVSSAPKAAVELFTRTLANEVRADNIRVSVIHPSNMSTNQHALAYEQVADLIAYVVHQPENVTIREMIVTPTGEAF